MHLGIKVGLKSDWKNDLKATRPAFCEIWFDSRKIAAYDEMFSFLTQEHIPSGIHFWGATPDGTLANFAYPNQQILDISMDLAYKTIETAAAHHCLYVNFHPSAAVLSKVNFDGFEFTPYTTVFPYTKLVPTLKNSFSHLSQKAHQYGIPLTLESTPKLTLGKDKQGKSQRLNPINIGEIPITEIETLFDLENIYFANDFGHTIAELINPKRAEAIGFLNNIARRLKHKTKLLHVSYIVPPYNGTDYHGSLHDDEFFTSTAIPNHDEIKQLLTLYIDNKDLYALVEPKNDHIGNYQALQKLVHELA